MAVRRRNDFGGAGRVVVFVRVSARVGDLRFLFPGVLPKFPPADKTPGVPASGNVGGGGAGMRHERLVSLIYISFPVQLLGLTSSTFRYLPRRSPLALG